MRTVVSKDGTTIAYSKVGKGPALLLVDCALYYRNFHGSEALAGQLAQAFTVYTYDRRGRGESGDTQPYAVAREIEDIAALIEEAGGSVFLYGSSSGAALALRAAASLGSTKVAKLALYEPPFDLGEAAAQAFVGYTQRMVELLAANQRSEAVAFFMADMMPPEVLAQMRQSPEWPRMEAVAHTLAYDNAVLGNGAVPTRIAQSVTMPALVLDGEASMDFLRAAVDELAQAIPHAQRKTLAGQTHAPMPEVIAPVLAAFFSPRMAYWDRDESNNLSTTTSSLIS